MYHKRSREVVLGKDALLLFGPQLCLETSVGLGILARRADSRICDSGASSLRIDADSASVTDVGRLATVARSFSAIPGGRRTGGRPTRDVITGAAGFVASKWISDSSSSTDS